MGFKWQNFSIAGSLCVCVCVSVSVCVYECSTRLLSRDESILFQNIKYNILFQN